MNTALANMPVKDREIWKYSGISPEVYTEFSPYSGADPHSPGIANSFAIKGSRRFLFINGVFSPEHSDIANLPAGVELTRMAEAPDDRLLGHAAQGAKSPITLANRDDWRDGVRLKLADGVAMLDPVEVVYLNDELSDDSRVSPRNLVVAGRDSSVVLVESFISDPRGDQTSMLNMPVTEVICGPGSHVDHVKLVNPGAGAVHVGSTHVRQAGQSRYVSREFLLGGAKTRSEVHVDLNDTGAVCDIAALYIAGDQQHHDTRTRINHNAAGCETRELYKGILDGESRTVFDGQILVARDAQQTSAHQTNRNLLLSDQATAYSVPRLEIYADDVKCSHGATTGQLGDDELFYLRTRGIDGDSARRMLAMAFAAEILEDIDQPELREALMQRATRRLGGLKKENE
jgi:Fe-S cluster assembly protein SufD